MSTYPILWEHDEPITRYEHDDYSTPEVPEWINQDISPADVAAIIQGGCDSGAYMPAVTYHQALATMSEHGCEVLDYIADYIGDPFELLAERLDGRFSNRSWEGLACFFVSVAVECWAQSIEYELDELLGAIEDDRAEAEDDEEDEDEDEEADDDE